MCSKHEGPKKHGLTNSLLEKSYMILFKQTQLKVFTDLQQILNQVVWGGLIIDSYLIHQICFKINF